MAKPNPLPLRTPARRPSCIFCRIARGEIPAKMVGHNRHGRVQGPEPAGADSHPRDPQEARRLARRPKDSGLLGRLSRWPPRSRAGEDREVRLSDGDQHGGRTEGRASIISTSTCSGAAHGLAAGIAGASRHGRVQNRQLGEYQVCALPVARFPFPAPRFPSAGPRAHWRDSGRIEVGAPHRLGSSGGLHKRVSASDQETRDRAERGSVVRGSARASVLADAGPPPPPRAQ